MLRMMEDGKWKMEDRFKVVQIKVSF